MKQERLKKMREIVNCFCFGEAGRKKTDQTNGFEKA